MSEARTVLHDGFWFDESSLLPEHVGSLVMIDHYAKRPHGPSGTTRLDSHSYVGTLAGFTESRGHFDYGPRDLGDQRNKDGSYSHTERPDISAHYEKFEVTVFLADGRAFTIRDDDSAYVRVYRQGVTS